MISLKFNTTIDNFREGVLLGYGNPLLDIQVVGTAEFLKK
jgi:hypothetical protein